MVRNDNREASKFKSVTNKKMSAEANKAVSGGGWKEKASQHRSVPTFHGTGSKMHRSRAILRISDIPSVSGELK